jgi:hypothetical protein
MIDFAIATDTGTAIAFGDSALLQRVRGSQSSGEFPRLPLFGLLQCDSVDSTCCSGCGCGVCQSAQAPTAASSPAGRLCFIRNKRRRVCNTPKTRGAHAAPNRPTRDAIQEQTHHVSILVNTKSVQRP